MFYLSISLSHTHTQETQLTALKRQLQELQESHSVIVSRSEQLVATQHKAEVQVAEQLAMRQEELSRTRAQVNTSLTLSHILPSPLNLTLSHPLNLSLHTLSPSPIMSYKKTCLKGNYWFT